jgi:hypothetical protein
MEPYAGADYNLPLRLLLSRLQHIYHGKPYARVDFIPQSGTWDLASVHSPNLAGQSRTVIATVQHCRVVMRTCPGDLFVICKLFLKLPFSLCDMLFL